MAARLSRRAAAWARGIEVFSTWAAGACLSVNVIVVLFGVIARYGFNASPIWTEELARFALIWAVLLAGAAALRRGEHMQIEIVLERLPAGTARVVDLLRRLVIFAVLAFMTVMGAYYAQKVTGMTTLAMNISRAIPMASIPAGMGLMLLQFLVIQVAGAAARDEGAGRSAV